MTKSTSMLRKRAERRDAKHQHRESAVFASGHAVQTNETRLHKSGVRGRKSVVLGLVFIFVILLAVANLIVTSMLVGVLRMTPEGVPPLHINSDGKLMFREPAELASVYVSRFLGGFQNENLSVASTNELRLTVGIIDNNRAECVLNPDEVVITPRGSFRILSKTGSVLFETTQSATTLNGRVNSKKLVSRTSAGTIGIQAGRIHISSLQLLSNSTLNLVSGRSLLFQTNKMDISAVQKLELKPRQQSSSRIHLQADKGVYVITNATESSDGGDDNGHLLCACLEKKDGVSFANLYKVKRSAERCLAIDNPCSN